MTIIKMMNSVCFKLTQVMFMVLLMLQVDLVCAEEVRCMERERQALLHFKASLVDVNDMLSSWGAEEEKRDCCQWKGVGCSNQTSHIEILDIGNCGLRGKIHVSLMELQHLKYLNLSLNDFRQDSHIPYFFGSLYNLRYLDLSYSYMHVKIPSQFGSLSHLEYLKLSGNDLEGSIPYQLGNLSKLQHLDLSLNNLEGMLPSHLGNLSKLQYLDLNYNVLGGKLPSDLRNLSKLQYLNVSWNSLEGALPSSLGDLSKLQYLDLSWNSLEGALPSSLGDLSKLQYLDLSWNGLEGALPSSVGDLSKLQYLDLSRNGLEGSLPSHLGNLSKLRYLDLDSNSLEGTIPSQLGMLSSLQKLFLYNNLALKFEDLHHNGGQWLSNLTCLTHLDLNQLSNLNNSHSWLQMIGKLPKLTELSLAYSSLSDNFFLSLAPSQFKFSTSLTVLDLSGNNFPSSIMFQWVSNISSNLVELYLSGNGLEGPISNDFGNVMTSLRLLDLSYNNMKGGVVKSFMNICSLHSFIMYDSNLIENLSTIVNHLSAGCARYSLQELDLRSNQITGTLPDLSIFSSLKKLDLRANRLKGKIPETMILPSQFESLHVDSNFLEGGIPKSFGDTCTLRSLTLSNNSLSEELPVIIHHLSGCARYSLQELHLRGNQINGTLPDLSIFPSLKVLRLGQNRLDGEIPENIRFPPQLWSLELSSNSLKGVISDSHFANMSKLKLLILHNNSLSLTFSENWIPSFQLSFIQLRSCKLGPTFPKWLHTQVELTSLDISNAGISDTVPEWFWALSTKLHWMNISYNNLRGIIPNVPLRHIECPDIILSVNQFEGPIPLFLRNACTLDLSNNVFSDTSLFLCANDSSEQLVQLDLSNNHLSGQIPDCWSNFKSLDYLDLSDNNLYGQIPPSLGSSPKLQILILRNNNLIGDLTFSLRNCTKLIMLDVGENKLSGLVPFWIGSSLQQLRMLSLRKNHFSGSLPLSLCHVTSIYLLDLSSNNLKGRIPKCFKNFSTIAQDGGRFSVDVSNRQWTVKRGYVTYIFDYHLIALLMWKGVEHTIKNDKLLLKGIDLSSNQLTGEIPAEMENLVGLVSLNLSRNNLTGKIPLKIGRLTSLEFLDLSRNQLVGSIPSSLTQIDRLTMLDVSHNYLSGQIPTSTQLQSFDASSYEYNLDLCGRPLEKLCKEEDSLQEPIVKFREDEDSLFDIGFYISMIFGFVIGFWGIFGPIFVKRSWRHAYFRFLNNLADNIYVMIAVKVANYRRYLNG